MSESNTNLTPEEENRPINIPERSREPMPGMESASSNGKYPIDSPEKEDRILPIGGRIQCMREFPELFNDQASLTIAENVDYDFSKLIEQASRRNGRKSALAGAARQYAFVVEIQNYLAEHPNAAVVNLGCGLDAAGLQADNGTCKFYNIDLPEVMEMREAVLPVQEREVNIACDLNDLEWIRQIEFTPEDGAIFYAIGVILYFPRGNAVRLFNEIALHFPGARIVFDSENSRGVKMDMRAMQMSGMEVPYMQAIDYPVAQLRTWSNRFAKVRTKGLMTKNRKPDSRFGVVYRIMSKYSDVLQITQLNTIDTMSAEEQAKLPPIESDLKVSAPEEPEKLPVNGEDDES